MGQPKSRTSTGLEGTVFPTFASDRAAELSNGGGKGKELPPNLLKGKKRKGAGERQKEKRLSTSERERTELTLRKPLSQGLRKLGRGK